jgi:uncharacterized membrane protein YfcA
MDLPMAILLFLGGLFAGTINVMVGGGSLISVPLLIASGLPAHLAVGTNRFAMVFNTGVGAIDYHRKIQYDVKMALFLAVFASAGSYLGANIVLQIDERILEYIIGVLMLILGGVIFYKKKLGLVERQLTLTTRNYLSIVILTFLLGIYGGFFGGGISTMFTFVFISYFGKSFIQSAGITRFIVSILSMVAVITFAIYGSIDFLFGIILAISFVIGAKLGVRLAVKAGNVWMRRLFIVLAIISSIKLFFF